MDGAICAETRCPRTSRRLPSTTIIPAAGQVQVAAPASAVSPAPPATGSLRLRTMTRADSGPLQTTWRQRTGNWGGGTSRKRSATTGRLPHCLRREDHRQRTVPRHLYGECGAGVHEVRAVGEQLQVPGDEGRLELSDPRVTVPLTARPRGNAVLWRSGATVATCPTARHRGRSSRAGIPLNRRSRRRARRMAVEAGAPGVAGLAFRSCRSPEAPQGVPQAKLPRPAVGGWGDSRPVRALALSGVTLNLAADTGLRAAPYVSPGRIGGHGGGTRSSGLMGALLPAEPPPPQAATGCRRAGNAPGWLA
jgi:hypothetical protein